MLFDLGRESGIINNCYPASFFLGSCVLELVLSVVESPMHWRIGKKNQIEESVVRTIYNTPSSPVRNDYVKCASTELEITNLEYYAKSCRTNTYAGLTTVLV